MILWTIRVQLPLAVDKHYRSVDSKRNLQLLAEHLVRAAKKAVELLPPPKRTHLGEALGPARHWETGDRAGIPRSGGRPG
jgi:hypothetical protein